jgi:hypothetical protein
LCFGGGGFFLAVVVLAGVFFVVVLVAGFVATVFGAALVAGFLVAGGGFAVLSIGGTTDVIASALGVSAAEPAEPEPAEPEPAEPEPAAEPAEPEPTAAATAGVAGVDVGGGTGVVAATATGAVFAGAAGGLGDSLDPDSVRYATAPPATATPPIAMKILFLRRELPVGVAAIGAKSSAPTTNPFQMLASFFETAGAGGLGVAGGFDGSDETSWSSVSSCVESLP